VRRTILADPGALDDVVGALDASRNPAIVTGAQIEEDRGWRQTVELAEHLNAPVYQQPIAARWTFPRTHRLYRGGLLPAQQPLADQLAEYDVVLVLGAPIFLYYAYVPGDPVKPGTRLFQITNSPQHAAAALAGTSIVGHLGAAAEYIRVHAKARSASSASGRVAPPVPTPEYPIPPGYLFSVLNAIKPHDAVICEECPSSKGDLDRYLYSDEPNSFYSVPNGVLGFGLPAAVGLQLANPHRRVICPVGDGSIQYSVQALWNAAQYQANVIFIVLRNGDYSALKSFCDFTHVGRNVHGMDLPGIDIVRIAQGYGLSAKQIDQPEDLEPSLREAFAHAIPQLLCVNVAKGGGKCMGMDQSVNPPRYR